MIQFYKPNPKVTGNACSFFLTADGSIMASMIKQDAWNSAKKTGSFSKNKGVSKSRVYHFGSLTARKNTEIKPNNLFLNISFENLKT
mgnify:CR=1 FL=1